MLEKQQWNLKLFLQLFQKMLGNSWQQKWVLVKDVYFMKPVIPIPAVLPVITRVPLSPIIVPTSQVSSNFQLKSLKADAINVEAMDITPTDAQEEVIKDVHIDYHLNLKYLNRNLC
jgi:hypothetical protein